jgi:hypothetical protein
MKMVIFSPYFWFFLLLLLHLDSFISIGKMEL